MTEILYLTSEEPDYLQDQVLLGLRRTNNITCIDYPRKNPLYQNCTIPDSDIHGNSFTIWKELDDAPIDRSNPFDRLYSGEFDALIFGSVQRQNEYFSQINFQNVDCPILYLDGEDRRYTPSIREAIPFVIEWIDRIRRGMGGRPQVGTEFHREAIHRGNYFKREKSNYTCKTKNIHPIGFSIPEQKILNKSPNKTQLYQTHVQCKPAYGIDEVADNSTSDPIFESESEYYEDLSSSKYGITMKKAGWECMRHYEIAANWAVPCFYKLQQKPSECAPHGLKDMYNCIIFNTSAELRRKVEYIETNDQYREVQQRTVDWVNERTCKKTAQYMLNQIGL